jgi:predicted metalloprotease with PDZ domain
MRKYFCWAKFSNRRGIQTLALLSRWVFVTLLAMTALVIAPPSRAQSQPSKTIKLHVDARRAPEKVLHAELEIPADPGPLTLFYCKWMPADHSPDGPIQNLTGLKFTADGKTLTWRRDLVDMYAVHLEVPPGSSSVHAQLDFLLSAPGPTIDFAADAASDLLILMWHTVLLYPKGRPANQIFFSPSLQIPEGWKFNTSLPVANQSDSTIEFSPVALDLLVDSPVQTGQFTKQIELAPQIKPPHYLDVLSDDEWPLHIPPELITSYNNLVVQADALYQSHHYRDYHFLLTLSDNVLPLGQEHHESSDDRISENSLVNPLGRLREAELFPHEFTHSWNGQYRRPVGMATPDFQEPMKDELLWVYEGLTDYLGTVLTARSGLWTPEQTRERIAVIASMLAHRAGRNWRSLQDTADSAQILYFSPGQWSSYRRSVDFYLESILIWLEVDTTIRKLTNGQRSMDDFCRAFLGKPDGEPIIKTYAFDDLITALNGIAPYDWRTMLRTRLDYIGPDAPLGGIKGGGWQLVYNDDPNIMLSAQEGGGADFTSSIGLHVRADGSIQDVIPGMAAEKADLSPYMKIIAVNGRNFSVDDLVRAINDAKQNGGKVSLVVSNAGAIATHTIQYQEGIRYPHLERVEGSADYLSEILKPLPPRSASGN